MSMRFLLGTAIVVLGLVTGIYVFNYYFKPQMAAGFIAQMPTPVFSVSTEKVALSQRRVTISAVGTLRPVSGVDLKAQEAGVVSEIVFHEGQDVKAGDLLLVIEDNVEQAQLKSARALLKNAETELARQAGLAARGASTQAQKDQAVENRDRAAAGVQQIEAQIARKRIRAPFSGRLGIRHVNVGQYVAQGALLVSLQSLDPLFVDFPIPEGDVPKVRPGQTLSLSVEGYPGRQFSGKVETLDVRLNEETRSLDVRGRVLNPDFSLLPGMFAQVTLEVGAPEEVLTLPATAVEYSLYGNSVYVVKTHPPDPEKQTPETKSVERRFVQTGAIEEGRVTLLEGVKEGEEVVTVGQLKLFPNALVSVNNASPLVAPSPRPLE